MKTDTLTDVLRRFPEVQHINDLEIRNATVETIKQFPTYFWQVPASSSGKYHNPFTRGQHGLWIHVKMAFVAYDRLVDSYVKQGLVTEKQADMGRSAILLHDMFKQGRPDERLAKKRSDRHTVKDHDVIAADFIVDETELPSAVAACVASHNGPWYDGPTPMDHPEHIRMLAELVHTADMIASSANITCGVYKPAREITEKFPNLPRAYL